MFRTARLSTITVAGPLLSMILGCHSTQRTVIAVIPETTAQEVWEAEHAGVEHASRAFGWDIYWNGPSREDDLPRQIEIVTNEINRHVAGLVLSPDHAVALISPVRSALAKGIPTVILGSPLGTSAKGALMFVMNDDRATGRMAAERASLYLHSADSVLILGINPNILGSIDRANSFEETLHRKLPQVHIIEKRSTTFSFDEAEESAEDTIHSEDALRLIFTLNINQTRGAYWALQGTRSSDRIRLIGCDQDLDLVHHLRTGGIDALLGENTFEMGSDAIQMIHQQLAGLHPESRVVVQPVLITRDNVDSDAVQQILNMNWRDR
jgi:ribose transport system substrate-binding protein